MFSAEERWEPFSFFFFCSLASQRAKVPFRAQSAVSTFPASKRSFVSFYPPPPCSLALMLPQIVALAPPPPTVCNGL